MQQVIVDISQNNVSFDSTSLVSMVPEDPSYEENELKKYRDWSCMFCNLNHGTDSGRRGYIIASKITKKYPPQEVYVLPQLQPVPKQSLILI
jgi:hypothetical protein